MSCTDRVHFTKKRHHILRVGKGNVIRRPSRIWRERGWHMKKPSFSPYRYHVSVDNVCR